jgi:acetyltransferase
MAPFQLEDARRAIEATRIGRLLRGFRHLAPADLDRLAGTAAALGRFGLEHPDVASVDLNPVIISDDGKKCWAVDVKVVTLRASPADQPRHASPADKEGLIL